MARRPPKKVRDQRKEEWAAKMRSEPTPAEAHLYNALVDAGIMCRHQQPLCGYIADFYIPIANLVIEVDGAGHFTPKGRAYDKRRTAVLVASGYTVLRFTNSQVISDVDGCVATIGKTLRMLTSPKRRKVG